ncbi:MAG: peroxiredoxin [Thermoguttaceae bacterium]|nr:peroxiredoxin [Thermoguttaceae bacterium]
MTEHKHEHENEHEREHRELAEKPRSLVGREAPTFEAEALLPDGATERISLENYRGRPVLLIFYALDFSCVCPTEIVAFSDAFDDFEAAGVQILAVSVDSVYSHAAWASTSRSLGGVEGVRFPLVSDLTKRIADAYGVLDCDKGVALRSLVMIDADGIVQAQCVHSWPFGHSSEEALRMAKALARFAETGESCPTDWRDGEPGILEEEAEEYYRERFEGEEEAALEDEIDEEILEIEISEIDETGDDGDFEKMKERDEKKDEKREKKERKEEEKEEKKREKEKDK